MKRGEVREVSPLGQGTRFETMEAPLPSKRVMRAMQLHAATCERVRIFVAPAAEDYEICHALMAEPRIDAVMHFEVPSERASGAAAYRLPLYARLPESDPMRRLQVFSIRREAESLELLGKLHIERRLRRWPIRTKSVEIAKTESPERESRPAQKCERHEQHYFSIVAAPTCAQYKIDLSQEDLHFV